MRDAKWVAYMRELFPKGSRVCLREMRDPFSKIPPGTQGTVMLVDDMCTVHCKWDNGSTLGLVPGEDSFSIVPPQTQIRKLYMPLTAHYYERDGYGNYEENPTLLSQKELLDSKDAVFCALYAEHKRLGSQQELMQYYREQDGVQQKVKSLRFTVEELGGKLWGVAEYETADTLSGVEQEQLQNYIIGQAADGLGEGFEQRAIKAGDHEMYVSLWDSGDDWHLMTEQELYDRQQMGGMQLG